MRSLFLVALPRSLTTTVYHLAREALGLAEPVWTSDGEILNLDRNALLARSDDAAGTAGVGHKYLHPRWFPRPFGAAAAFLDQTAQPLGFVYKDVVQPFVSAHWLASQDFAVLKVQRPVADVAYAMVERGWHYPRRAAATSGRLEEELLEGLLRAEAALAALPGEILPFDTLLEEEGALPAVLCRLYPQWQPHPVSYRDDLFQGRSAEILARRKTPHYRALAALIPPLRRRLETESE